MKKMTSVIFSSVLAISMFAGIASAHVTVQPKETTQGKYEVFTVRVPSEKEDSPTTKIEVKFPDGVSVSRFEPKPGWTYELQKDETHKITGVTWTTEGEGLSPTEFTQFNFQGKVSDQATDLSWKAYQTYKDGSVMEWVGAEGSEKPASVTIVNPKTAGEASDSHGAPAATAPQAELPKEQSSILPLYLSIAALVAGLLSLGISLKKRA
ncbi:YcnI family protein [Ammoniphilus sp. 3BR4]|uniref:YcnI family copper-binding membrane protein n=1 Tax=Ammoniphilus sp. 3BR4 TaxID=3158265 RepID=UPI00346674A4